MTQSVCNYRNFSIICGIHSSSWYIYYHDELTIKRLIYIYIYIQIFYCQNVNISGRRMWTIRFTYFDSKCMHLSKLLHNLWSTFFILVYLLLGRTDNRGDAVPVRFWFRFRTGGSGSSNGWNRFFFFFFPLLIKNNNLDLYKCIVVL